MKNLIFIILGVLCYFNSQAQQTVNNYHNYWEEITNIRNIQFYRVNNKINYYIKNRKIKIFSDTTFRTEIDYSKLDSIILSVVPKKCYPKHYAANWIFHASNIIVNKTGFSFVFEITCSDTTNWQEIGVEKVLFTIRLEEIQFINDEYIRNFFISFMHNYGYKEKGVSSYKEVFDNYFYDLYYLFLKKLEETNFDFYIINPNELSEYEDDFTHYIRSNKELLKLYDLGDSSSLRKQTCLNYILRFVQSVEVYSKKGKIKSEATKLGFSYYPNGSLLEAIEIPVDFIMVDRKVFYKMMPKEYLRIFDFFYEELFILRHRTKLLDTSLY